MSGDIMLSVPAVEEGVTISQMTEWLRLFVGDEGVVELRALKVPQRYGSPKTEFGFFDRDHLGAMATEAADLSNREASAVYFTLNPVHRDLHARATNRTRVAESREATSDVWISFAGDGCSSTPIRSVLAASPQLTKKRRRLGWSSRPSKHI